ncbi:MAG: hypothetical protein H7Y00_11065 [Fimbriimonadaceae bacterium]|nr:hypothetical protein [Chitinophagales bacterium]
MITKEELQNYLKENQHDKIVAGADEILQEGDDDLKHGLGLAYFHQKKFADATPVFLQLAEKHNRSISWFNVCTAAAGERNFQLADEAYKKIQAILPYEKHHAGMMPLSMITFYYMHALTEAENYAAAFPLAEKIKNFYKALFITGNHYVVTRGLPLLQQFLETVNRIFEHMDDKEKIKNWFADFRSGVDEEGKEKLEAAEKSISS